MSGIPLHFRLAELLRAAASTCDGHSEFRAQAEAALAEYDAKGYHPEEPIFILRGRDTLAADAVQHWVAKGYLLSVNPDKLVSAAAIAERMAVFPGRRLPT